MGQLLEKQPKNISSNSEIKQIINELKQKNIKDFYECINTIDDIYPTKYRLTQEEFDDIFGSIIGDTEPFFNLLQEFNCADVYEALGVICLFIGEEFETKCSFIFRLFDFDSSFSLERDELKKTIKVILKGICKIVGISSPNLKLVDSLTEACFLLMDTDGNGFIDYKEFHGWMCQDYDLQDFLLKYTDTQTFPNATRRMNKILNSFINEFNIITQNTKEIEESQLILLLNNILSDHDESMRQIVFNIIKQQTEKFLKETQYYQQIKIFQITENEQQQQQQNNETDQQNSQEQKDESQTIKYQKRDFIDVMKAWSSFSASDINNNNTLSIKELKILLWVYTNEEPDEFQLRLELQNIDADHSGTIDRVEWLNYLCLQDKTGGQVFKSNMKRIFEKFDKGEGFILPNQIKEILSLTFNQKIIHKKQTRTLHDNVFKLIDKLNKDILKEILELVQIADGQIFRKQYQTNRIS